MLLGELLVKEGVVTPAQVEEALSAQVIQGGRLGTNLVELGYLTEEQLARALGQQHRMPFTFGKIVPSAEALALVPANFADDKDLLPVRLEGSKLFLLIIDPDDISSRDAIARSTGKRVVPVVVPEFRMAQLLRLHCKAFRPVREVDIEAVRRKKALAEPQKKEEPAAELMSEDEFQSLYAAALQGGAAEAQPAAAQADAELDIVEELPEFELDEASIVEEPLLDMEVDVSDLAALALAPPLPAAAPAPAPAATSAPAPQPVPAQATAPKPEKKAAEEEIEAAAPISFAEAQKALAGITDRDDIARVVLRFAAGKYKRALLINVQRDMAVGWHGAGRLLPKNAARKVGLSLRANSTFKLVRDIRSHFLGPLKKDAAIVPFLQAIGGEPKTAVLMPILAGGRVVNILYGDSGPDKLASPDIGELLILAQSVGRSYEQMIAARKKRGVKAG